MTGYGCGRASCETRAVVVEVRAVNARFLDVRARTQPGLGEHALLLEEIARKRGERGRIDVAARLEGSTSSSVRIDTERARTAIADLVALAAELGLREPPIALLAGMPDLFTGSDRTHGAALEAAVRSAADAAFDQLASMRQTEGRALAADLQARVRRVAELTSRMSERASELTPILWDRLSTRIERLLEGRATRLDSGRLEQEVALLADRADVSEELTRLSSHVEQFGALLSESAEPVGKRLEFLLQEMGREVNTTGSKASDLDITASVLELKAELERMREQAQNIL